MQAIWRGQIDLKNTPPDSVDVALTHYLDQIRSEFMEGLRGGKFKEQDVLAIDVGFQPYVR